MFLQHKLCLGIVSQIKPLDHQVLVIGYVHCSNCPFATVDLNFPFWFDNLFVRLHGFRRYIDWCSH